MVSTTSWGRSPRTSASHPGTRHEISRGLDAGATRCPVSESVDPSSEESAKEGLSRGASALGNWSECVSIAPRTGSAPHPPWSCTVSVREGSLGEMHTFKGPAASCATVRPCVRASVRPCRVLPLSGNKTTDNEKFLGTRTGLPVRVQNVSKSAGPSGDGVSTLRGAQLITAHRLPGWTKPRMWMVRSDLRCFWLQRRRWRASCDMRQERRLLCRLMYTTVAVLSVGQSEMYLL